MGLDSRTVLGTWKEEIREEFENRWQYGVREAIFNTLFEMLSVNGIELEDAKMLKTEVIKFLVTEEGRKGAGRHKGWKEKVSDEFDSLISEYYSPTNKTRLYTKDYGTGDFLEKDPIITAWAKDRFGFAWNETLNLMAHQSGNRFNLEFQKDIFDSEWARTGENVPKWFVNLNVDKAS